MLADVNVFLVVDLPWASCGASSSLPRVCWRRYARRRCSWHAHSDRRVRLVRAPGRLVSLWRSPLFQMWLLAWPHPLLGPSGVVVRDLMRRDDAFTAGVLATFSSDATRTFACRHPHHRQSKRQLWPVHGLNGIRPSVRAGCKLVVAGVSCTIHARTSKFSGHCSPQPFLNLVPEDSDLTYPTATSANPFPGNWPFEVCSWKNWHIPSAMAVRITPWTRLTIAALPLTS